MKTSETLADILAEMRRHIQAVRNYPQDIDITDGDVEDWADRIEAAHRREKEQTEAIHLNEIIAVRKEAEDEFKHGNAAALREALGNVRDIVRELADEVDQLEEVDLVCNTDQAGRIEALFREALRIAKAALSAPPRNCDMFRTVDEAFAACHDDRGYISDPVAERRSTISFMLSDAPKTPKLEQRDGALPDGLFEPAQEVQGGKQ